MLKLMLSLVKPSCISVLGSFLLLFTALEGANGIWEWKNPVGEGAAFRAIAKGASLYVSVGDYGRLATSPDGVTWTERGSATSKHLRGVVWSDALGKFVAVGEGSIVIYSENGTSWSKGILDSEVDFYDAFVFQNQVYGVGEDASKNGVVFRSTDGIGWNDEVLSVAATRFNSISGSTTRLIAVGQAGAMYSSPSGTSWEKVTVGTTADIVGVAYGQSQFYAVTSGSLESRLLSSANGSVWAPGALPDEIDDALLLNVSYANLRFIIGATGGKYATQSVGQPWEVVEVNLESHFTDASGSNSEFVLVGEGAHVYRTPNGVSSHVAGFNGFVGTVQDLAFANGLYVGVGDDGGIVKSADTTNWKVVRMPVDNEVVQQEDLVSVTFGEDLWIAVGEEGAILAGDASASNWEERAVAAVSVDFNAVAFGSGLFVAVAEDGSQYRSDNTISWRTGNLFSTEPLRDVAFNANTFLAVGAEGVWMSSNGDVWDRQTVGGTQDVNARDVVVAAGKFYLLVEASSTQSLVYSSVDGVAWTVEATFNGTAFTKIVGGADWVWVLDDDGKAFAANGFLDEWTALNFAARSQITDTLALGDEQFLVSKEFSGIATVRLRDFEIDGFFGETSDLGDHWRWTRWFEFFNVVEAPFIYHNNHGWIYIATSGAASDGFYLYDFELETWFYTNIALQTGNGFMYNFTSNEWNNYAKGSSNPRWFYSDSKGWFTVPAQ